MPQCRSLSSAGRSRMSLIPSEPRRMSSLGRQPPVETKADQQKCPLLCPPAAGNTAPEPKQRGIIIRVSGVRVPPPASAVAGEMPACWPFVVGSHSVRPNPNGPPPAPTVLTDWFPGWFPDELPGLAHSGSGCCGQVLPLTRNDPPHAHHKATAQVCGGTATALRSYPKSATRDKGSLARTPRERTRRTRRPSREETASPELPSEDRLVARVLPS